MSYKQTVQYKDIALFMSKKGAHSAISNSGAGLTFLPNVQSINFSVDVGIEKINSISSDQAILKTIPKSPDVMLTISTIEDFRPITGDGSTREDDANSKLWKTFMTHNEFDKSHLAEDYNFYAFLNTGASIETFSPTRTEDLTGYGLLSFGNMFLTDVAMSQSVNNLLTSTYTFVGNNLEAQNLKEIARATNINNNIAYHLDFEHLATTTASFHNGQNFKTRIDGASGTGYLIAQEHAGGLGLITQTGGDKALELRDGGDLFSVALSGFSGAGKYLVSGRFSITGSQNLAEKVSGFFVAPYGDSPDNVFLNGNNPNRTDAGNGGSTVDLSGYYTGTPGETHSTTYSISGIGAGLSGPSFVAGTVGGSVTNSANLKTGLKVNWAFQDADFSPYIISLDKQTHPWLCRWGRSLIDEDFLTLSLRENVALDKYKFYFTGFTGIGLGDREHADKFTWNSPITFAVGGINRTNNGSDYGGTGSTFEFINPMFQSSITGTHVFSGSGFIGSNERLFLHRTTDGSLQGGNRALSSHDGGPIPNSTKGAGSVFINDVTVKQMNHYTFEAPSIDVDSFYQPKNITGFFYTDSDTRQTGFVHPYNTTSITIRGKGDDTGIFFIDPEYIQSYDLSIPVNREIVRSIGRKYPLARNPRLPTRGTLTLNTKTSSVMNTGDNGSLFQYIKQNKDYDLDIKFNNGHPLVKTVSNASLDAIDFTSSIGSEAFSKLQFSFDINNIGIPSGMHNVNGLAHGYSIRRLNPHYRGPGIRVMNEEGIHADVYFNKSGILDARSHIKTIPRTELQNFYNLWGGGDPSRVYVSKIYDQYGENHLHTSGIPRDYMPIIATPLIITEFASSGISFNNNVSSQQSTGIHMKFSERIRARDYSTMINLYDQPGGNDVNVLLGNLDSASSDAGNGGSYIFFSPDRSAYQISIDGSVNNRETGKVYHTHGTSAVGVAGNENSHFTIQTHVGQSDDQSFYISFRQNNEISGFDSLGATVSAGDGDSYYFGNFGFKELLIASGVSLLDDESYGGSIFQNPNAINMANSQYYHFEGTTEAEPGFGIQ